MPPEATQLGHTLGTLLTLAWLLPLAGFAIEIFGGFLWSRTSKVAAYLAVLCIGTGFVLSTAALVHWGNTTGWAVLKAADHSFGHETAAGHDAASGAAHHDEPAADHPAEASSEKQKAEHKIDWPKSYSGTIYKLAEFGSLRLAVDYHIDSLTLVMFTMV